MHDPKFEKDVQQRMEELSFSPPEAVWLNVEKAVRGEKKRRRILPFWLFFAPAVLLMGAGAVYFMKRTPAAATTVANAAPVKLPAPATEKGIQEGARVKKGPENAGSGEKEGASAVGAGKEAANAEVVEKERANAGAGQKGGASAVGAGQEAANAEMVGQERASAGSVKKKAASAGSAGKEWANAGSAASTTNSRQRPHGVRRSESAPAAIQHNSDKKIDPYEQKDEVILINNSKTIKNSELKASSMRGFRTLGLDRSEVTAKALPSFAKAPAKVELPKPRHPWESGFTAHLGVSSINQGLLDKLSVTSMDYRNSYSPVQSNPKTYTTSVQPDLSFAVGVFMQKALSKDWAFSLGLNLHYYSSRLKTGGMVTAPYASLAPSLISSGSFVQAAPAVNYPYYAPGDRVTYTNRYYFMELPASAIWQVGHSKKLPLYLEGGVSFSYLVSSNSLYYEPKAGVFYKDGSLINKTQVGVFSGLMFGLPIKGLSIQAGPQLQYGLTNLINNSGSGNQHLMYGGIKVVFLPGRSKPR